MEVKSALTENLGAKLIALVVALFMWFSASGQQEITRLFQLPLKLTNIPDTLTITGAVPGEVEVSITGTKRQLLYIGFKRARVVVNLSAAVPGRFRQALSVSNVMFPSGVSPDNVRIITPSFVDLFFERCVGKTVPVSLTLSGSIPPGYLLSEIPRMSPSRVNVRGAESQIKHLKNLPTKPIDLGKARGSFKKEVELDYNRKLYECDPDRVEVSVSVSPKGERVLANIPPTVLIDEEELVADVSPKTVSLTLEGAEGILDTISSGDVSVLLDLSGKPPGTYTLSPEVIVPDGIEKFSISADSLKVRIYRNTLRGLRAP